jgi:hypothetical protein
MSGSDHGSGATRRNFGMILGGLAAGTILGTTVVANAEDGADFGVPAPKQPERGAARQGPGVVPIDRDDIDGLASKLDALKLSKKERALLVGLLTVAADTIGRAEAEKVASPLVATARDHGNLMAVRTSGRLPSVRDQFRDAFIPGAVPDDPVDRLLKEILVQ